MSNRVKRYFPVIDAIQFNNENAGDVIDFIASKDSEIGRCHSEYVCQCKEPHIHLSNYEVLTHGQFLVFNQNGFNILEAEDFHRMFYCIGNTYG